MTEQRIDFSPDNIPDLVAFAGMTSIMLALVVFLILLKLAKAFVVGLNRLWRMLWSGSGSSSGGS